MASVFLSYDREDLDYARPIAAALEKSGHSVWWDRHIKGGAQYSKEIDKALKAADAVVVLWSEQSVESAWVRDEAAAGRDSGRLVPVTLDQVQPPLGFRQYQSVDLSHWKGRGKPAQLRALLDAVGALPGAQPVSSGAVDADVRARPRLRSNWYVLAAGLLAAGLALVALLVWNPFSTRGSAAVAAVVAGDSSAASRDFARDLLAKLGSVHSAGGDPVELISGAQRKRPDLVFEVSGSTEARQTRANVVLMKGTNGSVLWSKDFSRPAEEAGDLRQQLSYATAQVLSCALEALPRGRSILNTETLKLYLNGCADLTDTQLDASSDLVAIFRKVIAAAPTFQGAWSKMLLAEAYAALNSDEQTETGRLVREQVKKDIASARLLNRDLAAAYEAEISLLPIEAYARRLNLADRAVAANSDDPLPYSIRSSVLFSVGRLKEAIDDAQHAAQLNPLSPQLREGYIGTLADSGRLEAALQELQKAERLWPDSKSLAAVRFRIYLRYGDPLVARQLIRSGAGSAWQSNFESFLQARIDPTPSNVERAIEDARAFYKRSNNAEVHLVQTLSIFHREPELLALLMRVPLREATWVTDVMFRPAARQFWRDPHSLAYAKRVGLLQYWRTSGKWPDFCYETDLPYDCKAETAKLLA